MIHADYGLAITLHLGMALGAVAAALYGVARAACLADLVEHSIRCGEGDPELTEALRRDAEGEWD